MGESRKYYHESTARKSYWGRADILTYVGLNEELRNRVKQHPDGTPIMPLELDFSLILKNAPAALKLDSKDFEQLKKHEYYLRYRDKKKGNEVLTNDRDNTI